MSIYWRLLVTIQSKRFVEEIVWQEKERLAILTCQGQASRCAPELGFSGSPWRETLEAVDWHAQSQSITWVHWIVPDCYILLIVTSFSLSEENEGRPNYLVNTRSSELFGETEQLVQGHTLALWQNQTGISICPYLVHKTSTMRAHSR